MRCEQIHEQFADYLAGTLNPAERQMVQAHLQDCADCRSAVEVWDRLGDLSMERPSLDLPARFRDRLIGDVATVRRATPGRSPVWAWAAAAGLLVAGWLTGRYVGWPPSALSSKADEVATLRREVGDLREAVVVSMLRQDSATERLKGVLTSTSIERPDANVVGALIETLRHDPSVNVRLSAVDALKRLSGNQTVRRGFADALSTSNSPLVQIALIDAMVEARDGQASKALQRLETDEQVDRIVRQRAKLALERLSPRNE